jgi:hypothetical protein
MAFYGDDLGVIHLRRMCIYLMDLVTVNTNVVSVNPDKLRLDANAIYHT